MGREQALDAAPAELLVVLPDVVEPVGCDVGAERWHAVVADLERARQAVGNGDDDGLGDGDACCCGLECRPWVAVGVDVDDGRSEPPEGAGAQDGGGVADDGPPLREDAGAGRGLALVELDADACPAGVDGRGEPAGASMGLEDWPRRCRRLGEATDGDLVMRRRVVPLGRGRPGGWCGWPGPCWRSRWRGRPVRGGRRPQRRRRCG